MIISSVTIWLLYCVCFIIDILPFYKRNINPLVGYFSKCMKIGDIHKHLDYFLKDHHWYEVFWSDNFKIRFAILRSDFLMNGNRADKSLFVLEAIDEFILYEQERSRLKIRKAHALMKMSAYNKAIRLFSEINPETETDPEVLMIFSIYNEIQGDIDKACLYASKANDFVQISKSSRELKATILNDYGRMLWIKGEFENATEAVLLAYNMIKVSKDISLYSVIASNCIMYMSTTGYTREACTIKLEEFGDKIKRNPTPDNLIAFFNCNLYYCRELHETDKAYDSIKDLYFKIRDELDLPSLELFKASLFRIVMNGGYSPLWLNSDIHTDYEYYKQIPLLDRLQIFREYIGIFKQPFIGTIRDIEPYNSLEKMIHVFYTTIAIPEIESYSVDNQNNAALTYFLKKERINIKRVCGIKDSLELKKQYDEMELYLRHQGMVLEAFNNEILYADECLTGELLPVIMPIPIYEPVLLNNLSTLPPVIAQSMQLQMFQNNMILQSRPTNQHIAIAQTYLNKALDDFNNINNVIVKRNASIELAYLLCECNRMEEAKAMWAYYKENRFSQDHSAMWYKTYANRLSQFFDNKKEFDDDIVEQRIFCSYIICSYNPPYVFVKDKFSSAIHHD